MSCMPKRTFLDIFKCRTHSSVEEVAYILLSHMVQFLSLVIYITCYTFSTFEPFIDNLLLLPR